MIDDAWEIEPGIGAGRARFGMTRSSLRERFGSFSAFRQGCTPDLTDQYEADLLMLTCSGDEGLYRIEIADPWRAVYRGVQLGGRDCQTNGVTAGVKGYLRAAVRRPSKVISKAFR
ncbi:hypothetical protein AB0C29_35465, partial [Actinoplanes sp. NPDC048791]|uniref:hypothetical protein n=1 Tax=Actinoplanes sp. NPDC048791 TaxID=3154623 RepID=UPI0033C92DB0